MKLTIPRHLTTSEEVAKIAAVSFADGADFTLSEKEILCDFTSVPQDIAAKLYHRALETKE